MDLNEYRNAIALSCSNRDLATWYRHHAKMLQVDRTGKIAYAVLWTAIACVFAFLAGAA